MSKSVSKLNGVTPTQEIIDENQSVDVRRIESTTKVPAANNSASRTFDHELIDQFVGQAHEHGLAIDGDNGLLAELIKKIAESALGDEITDYLGNVKHDQGAGETYAKALALKCPIKSAIKSASTCPVTAPAQSNR